jgi:hypothetical protein
VSNEYAMLTYPGRVVAEPGDIAGTDEMGRYYEVLEVEVCATTDPHFCGYPVDTPHSHVQLQWASAETMAKERDRLTAIWNAMNARQKGTFR